MRKLRTDGTDGGGGENNNPGGPEVVEGGWQSIAENALADATHVTKSRDRWRAFAVVCFVGAIVGVPLSIWQRVTYTRDLSSLVSINGIRQQTDAASISFCSTEKDERGKRLKSCKEDLAHYRSLAESTTGELEWLHTRMTPTCAHDLLAARRMWAKRNQPELK